jgi:hypothetical protein
MLTFLEIVLTRLGPVAIGLKSLSNGVGPPPDYDGARHQTGDRLVTGAMLKRGHESTKS